MCIRDRLELASFLVLHGTIDTSRRETAVVPRSSKHGHGCLVLTNTRRPWHGVPGCVCDRGPDDCTPVDCLRSCSTSTTAQLGLLTACSRGRRTVRSHTHPGTPCQGRLVRPCPCLLDRGTTAVSQQLVSVIQCSTRNEANSNLLLMV